MKNIDRSFDELRKSVYEILDTTTAVAREEDHIYREMVLNIALLRNEELDTAELRLLNKAFRELRHAMRIFKQYRGIPKAAVFGSARTHKSHPDYLLAVEFGRKLAKKGWMIITGGASGIMEAAMVGAGVQKSFGLNILLPFEQEANTIIRGNSKLMYFKYFFTRKLMFLKESEATVLFPGGFGTCDEGYESMTLVQTGKARPRPIVLVDPPKSRFWKTTIAMLKQNMAKRGLIAAADLGLMRHVQDADAAVKEITSFYSNYHSSRFFKDWFLIRLRRKPTPAQLKEINRDFKDILKKGEFTLTGDIPEDDEKDPNLYRIHFHFDRSSFSRLRMLIDCFNGF